jgi:hypothetical protein
MVKGLEIFICTHALGGLVTALPKNLNPILLVMAEVFFFFRLRKTLNYRKSIALLEDN